VGLESAASSLAFKLLDRAELGLGLASNLDFQPLDERVNAGLESDSSLIFKPLEEKADGGLGSDSTLDFRLLEEKENPTCEVVPMRLSDRSSSGEDFAAVRLPVL